MKKLLLCGAAILALLGSGAYAEPPPPPPMPRSISVSGEAEMQVSPDQAALSISLVSKDKDLKKAKEQNDELANKLVAITQEYKIPKEKVATSSLYISPEYSYDRDSSKPHFIGYTVSRSLHITIDKLEIHERLLSSLVDAKIDQVGGVEFMLADREAQLAPLRVKAYENAKAKAEALAKAAGMQLGKPVSISTDGAVMPQPPRPMPMMAMAKMDSAEMSVAPSLPGMITLHASVNVTFGLE